MQLIDITRPLNPAIAVWPGDTPFRLHHVLTIAGGAAVNLGTLTMSVHTGTHVDAPYHFDDTGITLDQVDLTPYWGPAQVVAVAKTSGPLTPADFAHADLGRAPRLLVRSAASVADQHVFHPDYVYPSPELADYLGSLGILLYGADAPSMDHPDSKSIPGHHAMQRNGIAILEGLDLSRADVGLYELIALPLLITGGDGSPVRAILRHD